jgi:kinesin family member C2/C3
VQRSLDILGSKSANNDPRVAELKNALLALKLNELEVDVNSPQLMLHDELALLQNYVNLNVGSVLGEVHQGSSMPIPPPSTNHVHVSAASASSISIAADTEKIRALELENNNLRSLLKEAQSELSAVTLEQEKFLATAGSQSQQQSSETQELRSKLATLEKKFRELEADAKAKDSQLASKDEELRRANAAMQAAMEKSSSTSSTISEQLQQANLKIQSLEAQIQSMSKEHESKLSAKTQELQAIADKRVEELRAKLENEKEVMMDAMTQEVEAVEAAKHQEQEAMQQKLKSLETSMESLRRTNNQLTGAVVKVQSNARSVATAAANLKQDVRRELADYQRFMSSMFTGSLVGKIKALGEQFNIVNARYKRELTERKKLHNLVQELKGNIRVFMRCRPPTAKEIDQFGPDQLCVAFPNPGEVRVFNEKNREKNWEFDEVFGVDSTQEDVYRDVSDLVVSVLDGFNVCIFAYGQTGSGKTWTMSGPPDNRGVNFRALNELFERTQSRASDFRDVITVSILEVYNEEIRDLMVDPREQEKLDIRQGEFGNYVPGLTSIAVNNLDQVIDLLAVADRFRSQTQTNMNEHSSRSHMMMTIQVVSESRVTGLTTRGKLNLVDLAGSERINKSGATGQALKEAQNINKSLSALGDVIAARAAKQNHVPFRNSTLTYLLQDSLSQDSKTLMIVCASPMLFNSEETFCSLNFASRVRTVELGRASKNVSGAGGAATSAASASSTSAGMSAAGSAKSSTASSAASSSKRQSLGPGVR